VVVADDDVGFVGGGDVMGWGKRRLLDTRWDRSRYLDKRLCARSKPGRESDKGLGSAGQLW